MTDKDKMLEEFRDWLNTVPEGAELDNFDMLPYGELEAFYVVWQAVKESDRKEREAAKQRIAELDESLQECTNRLREKHHAWKSLQVEKEALEKKLAEQQAVIIHAAKCFPTTLGKYTERDTTELTKLLSAARQQGFEEGKQAGRDALQKELSEQEPVATKYDYYGYVDSERCPVLHKGLICSGDAYHGDDGDGTVSNVVALIPRPIPPQMKG